MERHLHIKKRKGLQTKHNLSRDVECPNSGEPWPSGVSTLGDDVLVDKIGGLEEGA